MPSHCGVRHIYATPLLGSISSTYRMLLLLHAPRKRYTILYVETKPPQFASVQPRSIEMNHGRLIVYIFNLTFDCLGVCAWVCCVVYIRVRSLPQPSNPLSPRSLLRYGLLYIIVYVCWLSPKGFAFFFVRLRRPRLQPSQYLRIRFAFSFQQREK